MGEEITAEDVTQAIETTFLHAKREGDDEYIGDEIFVAESSAQVPITNIDAIRGTAISDATGVVGIGACGVAGYVRAASRDRAKERNLHPGVLGIGTHAPGTQGTSPGVHGEGSPGVRGEGPHTGVVGRGGVGVHGETPGDGTGVGVSGRSAKGTGVAGHSDSGDGVSGFSSSGYGGKFTSLKQGQILLEPRAAGNTFIEQSVDAQGILAIENETPIPALPKAARVGELVALSDSTQRGSLWLCVQGGENQQAHWAQLLVGKSIPGIAS